MLDQRRPAAKSRFAFAFAALATFVLGAPSVGCKKLKESIEEKAMEKAGLEKTERDDQGQTFTFKGNKPGEEVTFGTTQKIPDNFPADVPVYPGAKVMAAAASGQDTFSITLTTNDPVAKVVEFYNSKIPADGERMAIANMLTYTTDKHRVTVMTNENEGAAAAVDSVGKTILVLTVGPANDPPSKKPEDGAKPKK